MKRCITLAISSAVLLHAPLAAQDRSPEEIAAAALDAAPVWDGHNDVPIQLRSRHWIITDANSGTEEVRGLGVIGQQPTLQPGESFEYTSGCPLTTPFGTMHGTYQMVAAEGDRFEVEVAPFTLSEPYTIH